MKTTNIFFLLTFSLFTISCIKNSTPPPKQRIDKQAFFILENYTHNGSVWKRDGFLLLDINHDDNKDKQFMIIDVENAPTDGYKFVIKKGPLPIDSFATNWPSYVKSVSYGNNLDMVINTEKGMYAHAPAINGKYTYTYGNLTYITNGIYHYQYLNDTVNFIGHLKGKSPQAQAYFWVSNVMGNSSGRLINYYFREGYYTDITSDGNGGPKLLTEFNNNISISSDSWKKIDAALTFPAYYYTHFFFDFDTWRYFSTTDFCPSIYGAPCSAGLKYSDYKSMDELMTWPENWAKK
jgi:hypothetical protein